MSSGELQVWKWIHSQLLWECIPRPWAPVPKQSTMQLTSSCTTCMHSQSLSCPTLCNPMDCSPPVSSVHGIFQTRILEWVAISYFRGSSRSKAWTHFSCVSCLGRRIPAAVKSFKGLTEVLSPSHDAQDLRATQNTKLESSIYHATIICHWVHVTGGRKGNSGRFGCFFFWGGWFQNHWWQWPQLCN